jgi:hypothetical protein
VNSSVEPLLHVGYHKTASSWLQNKIFADPSFGFALHQPRETVIFELVAPNPFSYDADGIRRAFAMDATDRMPVISHERLSGHPLFNGYDARDIADRLACAFGGSRVLIVIRRQLDMMLSLYKHHVRLGGTERIHEVWQPRTNRELRRPTPGLDVFEYHHLIAYYQKLFGQEHVLVLPYERIRGDATSFVGDICAFVGLPRPTEVPETIENPSVSAGGLVVARGMNMATQVVRMRPTGEAPKRRRLRFIRKIDRVVPKGISRSVEERWREALTGVGTDRFAESNRITSELTGLDLASLDYIVR